jgi:hypothetical protein
MRKKELRSEINKVDHYKMTSKMGRPPAQKNEVTKHHLNTRLNNSEIPIALHRR